MVLGSSDIRTEMWDHVHELYNYESWVVPARVGSALSGILGAEFRQIIDSTIKLGLGISVIKSIFLGRGGV